MRYLDICSGISAPTQAWKPLGWTAAGYSEIEKFPRAVLAERYGALPVDWDHRHTPGSNVTPLFGDFTQIEAHHVGPIDLLVGGTPCQDFSIAGLRAGLDGDRGNLSLEYLRLADRTRPRWLVWENVPGVLSIDSGRAFGVILGGMGELGYGFAYCVLDAQHFGVPQRRRRVFVVGYLGDWRRAAAVLFERHSLQGDIAPSRRTSAVVAAPTANGVGTCGADDNQGQAGHLVASTGDIAHRLNAGGMGRQDYETETMVYGLSTQQEPKWSDNVAPTLAMPNKSGGGQVTAVCVHADAINRSGEALNPSIEWQRGATQNLEMSHEFSPALIKSQTPAIHKDWAVRRLTPREYERLQGFPDDFTAVTYRGKPSADGPRYKSLGNSMAVPVIRWIGERIAMVDALAMPAELAA